MKKYIKIINMIFRYKEYSKLFYISSSNFITSLKEIDSYKYNIIYLDYHNYDKCYVWKFNATKEKPLFGSWIKINSFKDLLIVLKEIKFTFS